MTPTPYRWPEGKRAAVVFSVDVDAELPYLWSRRGQTGNSLGQLEQRRFGPRIGLWGLLDLIERFGITGSFYVPGHVADLHPEVLPGIAGRGHEVGLHGYYHERVEQVPEADTARWLDMSIERFRQQLGRDPVGYRSPAWELTPAMPAMLKARGLEYDSSLMGFDHPYSIEGLAEIPVQWLVDDAIYFKFNGDGSDRWHPPSPRAVLDSWHMEWQAMYEFGGLFMITVHDWISGRGQRILLLRELIQRIGFAPDVWWATTAEVARWHRRSDNWGRFDVPATTIELHA